ncbi:MAG: hypothetical protein OXQ29_27680 [Rhodospirillaceae bacterium]|nr:hypothetical protein [Rhodospirillaceae bacterium]
MSLAIYFAAGVLLLASGVALLRHENPMAQYLGFAGIFFGTFLVLVGLGQLLMGSPLGRIG